MDFTTLFKKRIEPFLVIGVIIILLIIAVQLYQGQQLREEINQNCGWEDEDYKCFCEKSEAIAIQNKMNNNLIFDVDEVEYVQVDR